MQIVLSVWWFFVSLHGFLGTNRMKKRQQYKIALYGIAHGTSRLEYHLTNDFFQNIEKSEIAVGNLTVAVLVEAQERVFDLKITITGEVEVACTKCLDNLVQNIACRDIPLKVLFGEESFDDGETIVVPEKTGILDLTRPLYEIIVLQLPWVCVHSEGECNQEMVSKMSEYMTYSIEDKNDNF